MPVSFKIPSPSSNKSALVASAEIAYLAEGGKIAVLKPKIDKISIVYDMWPRMDLSHAEKTDLHKHIEQALWDRVKDPDYPYSQAKPGKSPSRYRTNIDWTSSASKSSIRIQANPTKKKDPPRFFRFEFNPSILTSSGLAEFLEEWAELCNQASDREDIFKESRVTRLDIAIDMIGISIKDLIFRFDSDTKSHLFHSAAGTVESVYLGLKSFKKSSSTKAYNKRKQLEETNKLVPEYGDVPYTRLETTWNSKRPVISLDKLPNKLSNVSIAAPRSYKPSLASDSTWTWFLDSVRHSGEKAALSVATDLDEKAAFKQQLDKAYADLWRPSTIWKLLPSSLKAAGLTLSETGN